MSEPVDKDEAKIADFARSVCQERKADVYFYAGSVVHRFATEFCHCVLQSKQRKNAILLLTTFGGSGDAAYRMARCLQDNYADGTVTVLVSTHCKSAGTLLALGATEIVMCDMAELGPLDVQITKPDTLGERTSGLTPSQSLFTLREEAFQCFEKFFIDILEASGFAITTRTAAMIAARMTAGLYGPVYAQIDPMRLGEFQRAVQIAMEYGKRLNAWSKNLKDGSLSRLISGYPSHEFVIDKREAESLFHRVSRPTTSDEDLAKILERQASKSAGGTNADVRCLNPEPEQPQNGSRNAPDSSAAGKGTPGTGPRPSPNGIGKRNGTPAVRKRSGRPGGS